MTFDARAAAETAAAEHPPFEFKGMDGKDYELPNPNMIANGLVLKLQRAEKAGDESAMADLFAEIAPDAWPAIEEMPNLVTAQMMDAWYAKVETEGKEPSGSSAPNRAARRSKQTSKSGVSNSKKG